ncbi:MAG: EAL domain-containing protein [Pseudomonadota bacterium]|nr:EAL domain-containing protein [Pseudomonadota bacterium]
MLSLVARRLGRLSVGRKLLLIYLLDLSAVIFISGILINEKFIAIDFARKEMAGTAYIDGLRPVLLSLGGWQSTPVPAPDRLEALELAHGNGMESGAPSEALRAAIAGLQRADSEAAARALRQEALERSRALVTRVGNQSNLILDPDLDSYYTMSLVLLRFPELVELGAAMDARLEDLGEDDAGRSRSRTQYFILEGRLDAVAAAVASDYAEAYAAARRPLPERFDPTRKRLAAAIDDFRQAARRALDSGADAPSLAAFDTVRQDLYAALDAAWLTTTAELQDMLQARERAFFSRMWLHLGTALFLLMLILSAVFYVARQISLPLRRLSAVVDTVRKTGDHRLRADWSSGDEIGRLVVGFNDMLAQLDRERQIQQELAASARASEAQRDLVAAIPIPLMVTQVPGHEVLSANAAAQAWLGGRSGDPWAGGLEPAVRARFFQQLADRREVDEFEVRWRGGAEPSWAVLSARRLTYQGRDAVLTTFTPINHLKFMEQRLELWAKVFEASSEGIMIIDAAQRILTVNRALCRQTGHELRDLVGEHPDGMLAPDGESLARIWPQLGQRSAWQGEVRVRRRNGSVYPAWLVVSVVRNSPDSISHYIFTSIDISDRKKSEERIRFLALHDVLTELPNRSLCVERLGRALARAEPLNRQVGVLFIDLDRFKTINDSLGHHVGDALLRSVAHRLAEGVRPGDTVSRLGGDEFVIILDGVSGSDEVQQIVERRLIPLVRLPHTVDDMELHVSCSVGIAMYPQDGRDLDELMRHADVAMYQSKAAGRDMARFFTADMNERAQARLQIESLLRHAIERDELSLNFQPRVDAASGRPVGAEALLRWNSAQLGPVPPSEFIPIAEEAGLIEGIGAWVIRQACAQHAAWRAGGFGEWPVSINLSAVQLRSGDLVPLLERSMHAHGVLAGQIELELTESTLMEDADQTLEQLHSLKALGVSLAIDDFGTGYSSLNYLNRFPIDKLKIDRSFVGRMLHDPSDLAIVRAIVALGHTLGLRVVAEGVEDAAQAHALREAGCDEFQGFHFARPLPGEALQAWMRQRQADTGMPA